MFDKSLIACVKSSIAFLFDKYVLFNVSVAFVESLVTSAFLSSIAFFSAGVPVSFNASPVTLPTFSPTTSPPLLPNQPPTAAPNKPPITVPTTGTTEPIAAPAAAPPHAPAAPPAALPKPEPTASDFLTVPSAFVNSPDLTLSSTSLAPS